MEPTVKTKVLASTGTIGWAMIGIGNIMLLFFIATIGLDSESVFADLIWCIVLDIGSILVYVMCDERFKKVKKDVS